MSDSSITYHSGGAMSFNGPDAIACYRAAVIAMALGLLRKGITPTRGYTIKLGLEQATAITGKPYARKEIAQAEADVRKWVQEMKAALPQQSV